MFLHVYGFCKYVCNHFVIISVALFVAICCTVCDGWFRVSAGRPAGQRAGRPAVQAGRPAGQRAGRPIGRLAGRPAKVAWVSGSRGWVIAQ